MKITNSPVINFFFFVCLFSLIAITTTSHVFAQQKDAVAPDTVPADDGTAPTKNEDAGNQADKEIAQEAASAKKTINDYIISAKANSAMTGLDVSIAEKYLEILNQLIAQKTVDADTVWRVANDINRSLDPLTPSPAPDCTNKKNDELAKFICDVRALTKQLRDTSYTDRIHNNDNLSDQIKKRLPRLLTQAVEVAKPKNIDNVFLREDTADELKLFTKRFVSTNRFVAGIGFDYSYIPTIRYSSFSKIGFSPFQTTVSGGQDTLAFNQKFENEGAPSISLNAKIPYFTIRVLFPNLKETKTIKTSVRQRMISGISDDVFYRSDIESTLEIEFDASINLSLKELAFLVFGWEIVDRQADFGVGYGLVGFDIEDKIKHDLRFRSNPAENFLDLPASNIIESTEKQNFNTTYWSAYLDFLISDQITTGILVKTFQDDSDNNSQLDISGTAISLYVNWYPSFSW